MIFKELVAGKLSFGETFWKFGVGGLLFCKLFMLFSYGWISKGMNGVPIRVYYAQYFNPVKIDTSVFVGTFVYFFSLFLFVFYSIMMLKAVWRSAEKFEKSQFLGFMAKALTLIMITLIGYTSL